MMPLPPRLPRSEIGWQVPPWATRAEPPRDAFQYQTMVTESVAPLALIRWHHRFDSRPELVRNHTHSRHRSIVAGQHLPIRETRPSRASLTTNMRLLTAGQYVRQRTRPAGRTSYYRIEADRWHRAVRRKLASLDTFRDIASDALELLGSDNPRSGRIRAARESFSWVSELLNSTNQPNE